MLKNILTAACFFLFATFSATNAMWLQVNTGIQRETTEQYDFAATEEELYTFSGADGVFRYDTTDETWLNVTVNKFWWLKIMDHYLFGYRLYPTTGLLRSADNGANWENITSEFMRVFGCSMVSAGDYILAFPTNSAKTMYRSTDFGTTWNQFSPDRQISGISCIASLDNKLYFGADDSLIVSSDFGETWQVLHGVTDVGAIGFSGPVMVVTHNKTPGYAWTSDNGTNWHNVDDPVLSYCHFATLGSTLYSGKCNNGGILASDDGHSWQPVGTGLPLECDNTNANIVSYKGKLFISFLEPWGMYKLSSDGVWAPCISDDFNYEIRTYSLQATSNSIDVLTSSGLYTSSDNGTQWSFCDVTGNDTHPYDISGNSGMKLAITPNKAYLLKNGTQQWQNIFEFNGNRQLSLRECLVTAGDTLILGISSSGYVEMPDSTFNSRLVYSIDNGVSWNSGGPLPTDDLIVSIIVDNAKWYVATANEGVFVSTDNSVTWDRHGSGFPSTRLNCLLMFGTTLYAGTSEGVYALHHDQVSWTPCNDSISNYRYIYSMASNKRHLFAATVKDIMKFNSDDATWAFVSGNLPVSDVNSIAVSDTFFYAASATSGIWREKITSLEEKYQRIVNRNRRSVSQLNVHFGKMLDIRGTRPAASVSIRVFDLKGTRLYSDVSVADISGHVTVPIHRFIGAAGSFIADIQTNDKHVTSRFIRNERKSPFGHR